MITNEHKQIARQAMDYALKHGCQSARISLQNSTDTEFGTRQAELETLKQSSENSMTVELFVDGRYGNVTTNRINRKEIEGLIRNGIDSTRCLAEDPARALPDPARYYTGGGDDLGQYDASVADIDADTKVALALDAAREIHGSDPHLVDVSSEYFDTLYHRYLLASNGFEGESSQSFVGISCSASIKGEGDARPSAGWYEAAVGLDTLKRTDIGRTALTRALRKLGQKKIASGKYTMVLDNLNSLRMLSPLISAMSGGSIYRKQSFLIDKKGEQIAAPMLTLMHDPHLKGVRGAAYFDGEGVRTEPGAIIKDGVLQTYFINTYFGNKLGMEPTYASPQVITTPLGTKDLDGLVADVKRGILVTGFNGGNSNSVTGDFSFGIEGFLIENGVLTQPVNEMNITGNMLDLWQNLVAVGNDPRQSNSWRIPSLVFEGVNFSGV